MSEQPLDSSVCADFAQHVTARAEASEIGAHWPIGISENGTAALVAGATAATPVRVLMVASTFQLAYRVMRCAQASGASIHVLGTAGAAPLRCSRHCRGFTLSGSTIHGDRDAALALEINCLVKEQDIGMVMPGDAPSTRALIASRDLIEPRCFPLPELETFDLLNSKWAFATLCRELGIRHPDTQLLPDRVTLANAVRSACVAAPLVAKPLSRSGGSGVIIFDGTDTERRLRAVNYQPILVQEFVPGYPVGASVYAHSGKIEAFIAHHYRRRTYTAFHHDSMYADIGKIVAHRALSGVYNFDMIAAPDGSIHYLECNPRFFYKINLSMIAGVNFVACGLARATVHSVSASSPEFSRREVLVRFPEALLASPLRARPTRKDWAMASYLYSDPWPYLLEKLRVTV